MEFMFFRTAFTKKNCTEPLKKVQNSILHRETNFKVVVWIHNQVCVTVFTAGHTYTTVFNAYTYNCQCKMLISLFGPTTWDITYTF